MSSLQYFNYPGFGEEMVEKLHYSQAVRVGDRIETSGQGGWDPKTHDIPASFDDEVDQAFSNVYLTLRTAGGKGWSQVFRVNIYYVGEFTDKAFDTITRNFKQWMPDHQPLYTIVAVRALGLPGMRIEVEVVALDPK